VAPRRRWLIQAAASRPRGYEDQATEILACVLEASPGLAGRFAERITTPETAADRFSWDGVPRVNTQRVHKDVGTTDLEVEWHGDRGGSAPLRVVKSRFVV